MCFVEEDAQPNGREKKRGNAEDGVFVLLYEHIIGSDNERSFVESIFGPRRIAIRSEEEMARPGRSA